jgi:uncharacterized phage protein gp47/JayE
MIRPQANQISIVEQEAVDVRTLFTLQFPTVATTDEIQQALLNYGCVPGGGSYATVLQYFMRYSVPTTDITISAGTLVSNNDGTLVYQVLNPGTISAENVNAYYNPTRNTYEIALLVQAVGTGTAYNLPQYRINTLATTVVGIDGTENRSQASGGEPSESTDSQSARLVTALQGTNLGAPGGISKQILNTLANEVTDVSIIQPSQPEFARITAGPALDVYVIGQTNATITETTVGIGGQTIITVSNHPVVQVDSLTINNTSVSTYTLVPDTSPETGYSLDANDVIVLASPLLAGDNIVITYEYNKVPSDVYTQVLNSGEGYFFNTDMLVRSPFPVYPVITGTIQILPSYSTTTVQNNVIAYLTSLLTFTTFSTDQVLPSIVVQNTISNVPGIQTFTLSVFHRNVGALSDVEAIILAANETLSYNPTYINITVVS